VAIATDAVSKQFGSHVAVDDVSLEVPEGSLTALLGPSGCGKSTLLRMIAGLEEITGGEIEIGGRIVNNLPPKERDIAMVFQNYALYPHMKVRDNMAFSMLLAKRPRSEIDERVNKAASILGLTDYLDRYPRQLSGGQRQRVGVARALAADPALLLFDEPFGALDPVTRRELQQQFLELNRDFHKTSIFVTHDIHEAMRLGTRIALLAGGRLETIAAPAEFRRAQGDEARAFLAGLEDC